MCRMSSSGFEYYLIPHTFNLEVIVIYKTMLPSVPLDVEHVPFYDSCKKEKVILNLILFQVCFIVKWQKLLSDTIS